MTTIYDIYSYIKDNCNNNLENIFNNLLNKYYYFDILLGYFSYLNYYFLNNLSCMFPFVSNLTQSENINSSRGSDNGAKIGIFQKMFSYIFYGNSDFYDLPNAF